MLQRHVHAPLLINGRKFSLGVFVVVMSLDPLVVLVHDDTVVLLCSHAFAVPPQDLAAHLTNRKLMLVTLGFWRKLMLFILGSYQRLMCPH
jgi:hypothetical protein